MKDAIAIRQCGENIRAVLKLYDLPEPVLLGALSDRVLYDRSRIFLEALEAPVPHKWERWDFVKHHRLDFPAGRVVIAHGVTAIRGWRERVSRCSVQIVEHSTAILEIDVDEWNPSMGAGPVLFHLGEVWRHYIAKSKTSPWVILKSLRRRGLSVQDVRTGEMT